MKIIDNLSLSGSNAAQAGRTAGSGAVDRSRHADTPKAAPAASGDQVRLSGLSGKIGSAMNADAAQRAAHVAKLTAAVRGGTYKVDAQALSSAMVSESLGGSSAAK
jgi:flagellar biosynthesis anti-sigma factor FlgM